ncbi:DUF2520 domain-containing protein [Flavimobilis sp. GY10621]|uniref:DUF2520 domain-containing protein n=1 Tax=Flavimobilis rhizosphaerae TaxID=2775421 RepID=A0ABR9DLS0_9MICO|nr:DUF2520 domain-containing protein [Flavimobilis rhizosphaerae]MBD9698086.1 DUF2520 domain-containing protein [Flavimobilis rhizosphaerae]
MSTARPGRLRVGVVGAGRVGAVLGAAMRALEHDVVGVSAVSEESLERAATLLPGVPVLEVPDVVRSAQLVLLTVPDDALGDLVTGLAALGAWQPGQLVIHTSGRFGTYVLAPAAAAGAIPLALHPAMTFTGTSLDLARLEGTSFAVTCGPTVQAIGQAIVMELGGDPVVLPEERRGLYHAALAHASNHLVVLVSQAAQALGAGGVEQPGAVLGPLLRAALDGALRAADVADSAQPPSAADPGAMSALTGPVVRGDVGTVREHLDVLAGLAAEEDALDVLDSYRVLARAAAARSVRTGRLAEGPAREIMDVLAQDHPEEP